MRDILAFIAVIFLLPGTTSAQTLDVGRAVQLIEMRNPAQLLVGQDPAILAARAQKSEDLSRPAFQMFLVGQAETQKPPLSQGSTIGDQDMYGQARPTEDGIVALEIPLWMRSGPSGPQFSPGGCSQMAYRPSGFLEADAERRRAAHFGLMREAACQHGIPVGLFDAMIISESRYNPSVVSPKGAFGLTQLMPLTAAELGVNRYDNAENLKGGARYLRAQLDRYGAYHLALAAYNAGPGRIRNGAVPQIGETQRYVARTLANWDRLGRVQDRALINDMKPSRPAPRRMAIVTLF